MKLAKTSLTDRERLEQMLKFWNVIIKLRRFFASHARTSHVQIKVRAHTCAHANSLVVALRTRTFSYGTIPWIFFT